MARHSISISKGWFGGWIVKCSKCGKLGSYHLKKDAQWAAGRHG
jgi:hypothetical protein